MFKYAGLISMEKKYFVEDCPLIPIFLITDFHYYYYYHHYHHHRISHFSALAGKYSPILLFSNQQDYSRWSYL